MSDRESGIVKWYDDDEGYGFIKANNEGYVYVHYSAILCDYGDCTLNQGDEVEFTLIDGSRGPQAQDVVVINE